MLTQLTESMVPDPLMPEQEPGDARQDAVAWGPSLTVLKGTIAGRKTSGSLMYPYSDIPVTPEIQTITKSGTVSGGTYTLAVTRAGVTATTGPLAYNATAATVQAALESLVNVGVGGVVVTGGPVSTTALTLTFNYPENLDQTVSEDAAITGGGTLVDATTQAGATTESGVEKAMCIAMYSFKTDASGKVYFSTTSAVASPDNPPHSTAPVWKNGIFDPTKLVGLDARAVIDLHAVYLPNGFIKIP